MIAPTKRSVIGWSSGAAGTFKQAREAKASRYKSGRRRHFRYSALVIDEDGCYDPAEFNDGLVLARLHQLSSIFAIFSGV